MHSPDELKTLVEEALERLDLWPELHGQATSVRYSLEVGGKRVRPVIALAVGEALGAPVAQEPGLLFQIVDDILDEDGYVREHGTDGARRYADEAAERARARLAEIDADTSTLREIVDSLAVRTA